jgi:hypothetical protein
MPDVYTEVTTRSWGGRIGDSFKGIAFGFILLIAAAILLWWNEGRAVERARTLAEGHKAVVPVSADRVDPANEGKLVHVCGTAATEETLSDSELGLSAVALRLRREVQMYQWHERKESKTERKVGGSEETTTTYTYEKVWAPGAIASSGFKHPEGHENPAQARLKAEERTAQAASLGAFQLTPSLTARIDRFEPLPATAESLARVAEGLRKELKLAESGYYLGAEPSSPKVGDLKITLSVVKSCDVSVTARQFGKSFEPYISKAGGEIEMLRMGRLSADTVFKQAEASNRGLTWLLRAAGFVVMWIGLALILAPLGVLADVLPFLGTLVRLGTGAFAFVVALVVSLLIIVVAWLFYRPVIAVIILALGAAGTWAVVQFIRQRKAAQSGATPPAAPAPTPAQPRPPSSTDANPPDSIG